MLPGQLADVADQADHRPAPPMDAMVVDLDPQRDRQPAEGLAGRNEVRRRADLVLQLRSRLVHDHRVDADRRPSPRSARAPRPSTVILIRSMVRVRPARATVDRLGLVLREAEVAGEQVGRALRHDAHGMPLPASPSATIRTVPSPPAAMTRSSPASRGGRAVIDRPGSSSVVSSHSGSAQPVSRSRLVMASRKPSDTLMGLATPRSGVALGRHDADRATRRPACDPAGHHELIMRTRGGSASSSGVATSRLSRETPFACRNETPLGESDG